MTEEEKIMLIEADQRSKGNSKQINELREDLKKLEDKTEDIHRIATSIEVVCNDIGYIKKGQVDLTNKVDGLSMKMDNQIQEIKTDVDCKVGNINAKVEKIEKEPYETYKKDKHDIKLDVVKQIVGYLVTGVVAIVGTLVGSGVIKL